MFGTSNQNWRKSRHQSFLFLTSFSKPVFTFLKFFLKKIAVAFAHLYIIPISADWWRFDWFFLVCFFTIFSEKGFWTISSVFRKLLLQTQYIACYNFQNSFYIIASQKLFSLWSYFKRSVPLTNDYYFQQFLKIQ